jgi:hypothetical protein
MKKFLLFVVMMSTFAAYTQVAPNYYAVKFTDKGNSSYSLDHPEDFLSQRSIDRRVRQNIGYDSTDLPIIQSYVEQVAAVGVEVKRRAKWINTILIKTTNSSLLDQVNALPFVENVTKIADEQAHPPIKQKSFFQVEEDLESINHEWKSGNDNSSLDYGAAYGQINQINGIPLHDAGFQGQGMVIAILDAGFIGVPQRKVFDSLYANNQILGSRDFASEEDNPFLGSTHGTKVLSTMGANWPGEMIGTAPKADFWLVRTEFADYENIIEEYNWVVGAAFADSVGADVINSSLGYTTFDDPNMDHTWADLDGNTAVVTIGADLAAKKGILPVNSAGNSGGDSWNYISCPADGDSVFTIGAVDVYGNLAYFSSRGLPTDPRVKPNICADGDGTTVADAYYDVISSGSGTSFSSPIIAGMTACLWQANYDFNNQQIMEAIEMSATQANDPDNDYGYGIPDYGLANSIVGIHQQNITKDGFNFYPNPATNYIFLSAPKDASILKIIDINACVVMQVKMDSQTVVNIKDLPSGIYLLQLWNQYALLSTKKLIKE